MHDDRSYQAGREQERERFRLLIDARIDQLANMPRVYKRHLCAELLLMRQSLDL
jgi:hypothetical protein